MRVAVVGAGIMGTGIAQVCAEAGLEVALQSRSRASLDAALDGMRTSQRQLLASGLLTESAAAAALERVHTTQDLAAAVDGADVVSENVPEDLGLKRRLFRDLDRLAPPAAILSTNTSGLPITAIATGVARPERVVGLHWLNPPQLTIAVEVTRGAHTSDATMRATVAFAARLGRRAIRVERDVPGFLWNRLQMALVREAVHVVEQGIAKPEDVDLAIELGLGLRWAAVGPFRIMDLAGIATFRAVAAYVYPELSNARAPQALLDGLLRTGATGARAGRGFYEYAPGAHDALVRTRDARLIALRKMAVQTDGHARPTGA